MMRLLFIVVAGSWLMASTALATYPERPLRYVIPSAAGGGPDTAARVVMAELSRQLGQQIVVDNRAGGSGVIGTEMIAKATPDGYIIGHGNIQTLGITRSVLSRLPYNPDKDLQPVVQMYFTPNLLTVTPSLPVKSVQELVALGRARPKALTYASQGIGSSGHMAGELFKITAKLDIVHVPYKGAAPAIQDLMGGHVTVMFDIVSLALPHIRSGKMKALAVVGKQRVPVLADLPTMAEVGLPAIEGGPWFGLFARTGTTRPVIDWLNREVAATFNAPENRDRFTAQGVVFDLGSAESFGAHVAAEHERWKNVIQSAGIRID